MITLYSEIFKIESEIIIVEIFRDREENKYIKFNKLEHIDENKKNFILTEQNPSYQVEKETKLLFESEKQKFKIELKKELTLSLEKLKKGEYNVNVLKNNRKYNILNLKIY